MKLSRQELFLNRLQNKVAMVTGACRFMLLPVDVTDEKGWVDVLQQIASIYGGLDVLVNNKGTPGAPHPSLRVARPPG